MLESATDRATERKVLESRLQVGIRAALASIKLIEPAPSLLVEAIDSVEHLAPNRVITVRRFLSELLARIDQQRPRTVSEGATEKELEDAILQTEDIAYDYGRLADAVATIADEETARALYRGFGPVLEGYEKSQPFKGTVYPADFDFMKFLGHELFTIFVACLLREGRWALISKLLAESIPINYRRTEDGPANGLFADISDHLEFGIQLNRVRQRICVHADILKARHAPERPLGQLISFGDFVAADYFLFLRGDLAPDSQTSVFAWRPWSTLFLKAAPRFIRDAEHLAVAQRLTVALGLPDVPTLRQRLEERTGRLRLMWRNPFWDPPLSQSDIDRIGTQDA